MLKDDARQYVLRKWNAFPPEDRRTTDQAAVFAMRIANEVEFRTVGDRYQVINGWLINNLARP